LKAGLTRIVDWSHELLAQVVKPGDLVVDLTAGNGHDTLMLYRLVGDAGQVIAFDIQTQALQVSRKRLLEAGATVKSIDADGFLTTGPGVTLVAASHTDPGRYLSAAPRAVVANLGYLPGGDRKVITRPETTLGALRKSCRLLADGGRLVVVVYPGHDGGRDEAELVDQFFQRLSDLEFDVLCLRVSNRPAAPYLHVAEKRFRAKQT